MTVLLLGSTVFISGLLSSPVSPTQIQKTKAAAKTYTRTVVIPDFSANPTAEPSVAVSPTTAPLLTNTPIPTLSKAPTSTPALLAQAPTLTPTSIPTKAPLPTPTTVPTHAQEPLLSVTPKPTLQPLLAYKSTSISPTLIPITNTGGMTDPTKAPASPAPTKKAQPTGVQQLPETGWIQTSSILFIVAASTILFSLLF